MFCSVLGDNSHTYWETAPESQRESVRKGVEAIIANPALSPEESHNGWMAHKLAQGWVYGETKDAAAKTHPCLLPYAELAPIQRAKDELFGITVRAVLGISPVAVPVAPPEPAPVAVKKKAKSAKPGKTSTPATAPSPTDTVADGEAQRMRRRDVDHRRARVGREPRPVVPLAAARIHHTRARKISPGRRSTPATPKGRTCKLVIEWKGYVLVTLGRWTGRTWHPPASASWSGA
ncbi:MAG: hypothetical protein HC888_11260 [Candidatus Competibacteraceae bacterium]|nr:hypothetical protein [Candidatus Competibacteraceae bacterium]